MVLNEGRNRYLKNYYISACYIIRPNANKNSTATSQIYCCSFALDTAALLGGDEFLIEQLVEELQKLEYNDNEQKALNWALTEVII